MKQLTIYKVDSLPAILNSSSIYFIKDDTSSKLVMHLTDKYGSVIYRTH